ncbi:MAG: hypothetical protein QOG98_580, partial [Pseudonocardiales bacterium]|nr:hypothetical protein [Pseudonocardiales bacterium]
GGVSDVAPGAGDDIATGGKGVPVIEAAEGDRTGDNTGLAVGDAPAAHAEVADTTKLTAANVKRQLIGASSAPKDAAAEPCVRTVRFVNGSGPSCRHECWPQLRPSAVVAR